VTLKRIAQDAGVSLAAVTLAVNGRPGVSDRTRQRVQVAARRLGYTPRRAQAVRTYPLGLVVEKLPLPILQDIFYAEVIAGMLSAAHAGGHALVLHVLEETEDVTAAVRVLRQRTGGLLLLGGGDISDDCVRQLAASGVAFVLVDNYVVGERLDCVLPDNFTAGQLATAHLIDLGHRPAAHPRRAICRCGSCWSAGIRRQQSLRSAIRPPSVPSRRSAKLACAYQGISPWWGSTTLSRVFTPCPR
jgi:DNA-binding LacI/PurR family transcriptional regulator